MARKQTRNTYNSRRISEEEYSSSFWAGFKSACYESQQSSAGVMGSNITAIVRGMQGETIEPNSMKETMAFKSGYKRGSEFKALYLVGQFPDLEDELRGGSRLETGIENVGSQILETVEDPIGEISDFLSDIF